MPKVAKTINQFHGGFNSHSSRRDVADTELTKATDVMVDELGKIRLLGGSVAPTHPARTVGVVDFTKGHGLFNFSHDYPGFQEDLLGDEIINDYKNRIMTTIPESANITGLDWAVYDPSSVGTAISGKAGLTGTPPYTIAITVKDLVGLQGISLDSSKMDTANGKTYRIMAKMSAGTASSYPGEVVPNVKFAFANNNTSIKKMRDETQTGHVNWENGPNDASNLTVTNGEGDWYYADVVCASTSDNFYIYTSDASETVGDIVWYVRKVSIREMGVATATVLGLHGSAKLGIDVKETSYTILTDATGQNWHTYTHDTGNEEWSAERSIGSANSFEPIIYSVDGITRVKDGNLGNAEKSSWNGYLDRFWFSSDDSTAGSFWADDGATYNGWHSSLQPLPKLYATAVNAEQTDTAGKVTFSDSDEFSYGGQREPGNIGFFLSTAAAGTWDFANDNYIFFAAYIFEGGYNSRLVRCGTNDECALSGENKQLRIHCRLVAKDWFTYHSPRAIGIRIFYQESDTAGLTGTENEYYGLSELYFDKIDSGGLQKILSSSNSPWFHSLLGVGKFVESILFIKSPPKIVTYEDINGYGINDVTDAEFKTVVIANRMAYVGNIKQNDGNADVINGDMMIKSPVNGFDIFPKSRGIEASIRDGDAIIKLEEYADRILQFKKKKMHLINISQEVEFLEDTFNFKGVKNPYATCKTDFGIAWVNTTGCYLYDGKQVTNLLEKQGRKLIADSEWQTFTQYNPSIAYLPKKRQLLVCDDVGTSGSKHLFMYDMVTGSWVRGEDTLTIDGTNRIISNFSINADNDLSWAYIDGASNSYGKFLTWSDTSLAQDRVDIRTKALAFGNPTQRKKIYNIYVTHKNAGDSKVGLYGEFHTQAATGNQPSGELTNDFFIGYLAPDANQSNYITQKFSMPTQDLSSNALSFNNVYTLRLYFLTYKVWAETTIQDTEAPAGFAINDITIVYRLKSVK